MARKLAKTSPSNIPPEIIEIILSKLLSVKSLLRFKAVSKSWNTIISDPLFIQNHLESSNSSSDNNLFLMRFTNYSDKGFSLVKLESQDFDTKAVLKSPYGCNTILCSLYSCYTILCECNGVLLVGDSAYKLSRKYVLWNPSTRKEIYFDCPCALFDKGEMLNPGICYDPITGDFKVVLIGSGSYAIYSCKNNSWTEKKLGIRYTGTTCHGIFVDGATYWRLFRYDGNNAELLYFDPRTDELKTLQKPEQVKNDGGSVFIGVACLRGNLCLYVTTRDPGAQKIQIWIKEKGIRLGENPNWKELITITENVPTRKLWFKPLCFVGNEILIQSVSTGFLYYSPSEKTFEVFDKSCTNRVIPFRNSLYF